MRQRHSMAGNGTRPDGKRPPGRPRSEEARVAILRNTLEILGQNGFADFTIESVAARAGVGKATVYRWWPNKGALIADAFANSTVMRLRFPDTGSLQRDMSRQMRQLVKVFSSPRGRIVSAILGAGQSDPELIAAFRERFLIPRRQEAFTTLRRGILRGELRRDVDPNLLLDSLYGPIYMRFLIRHDRLSADFVDRLCALVLAGARPQGRIRTRRKMKMKSK
ncbi:MAG: TetR/AcrR family transcriptional regulator [Candidatus Sulfotelmatobacter sp.]